MADFDSNPFADPDGANPFADPSVRQATQPQQINTSGLDDFNPFDPHQQTKPVPQQPGIIPPPQPAVMQPMAAPPPYSPSPAQSMNSQQVQQNQQLTEDLQRRQEELERKAAELARKEQELKNQQYAGAKQNNFPPLPEKCCVQPCFYQDFSVDIPLEFQRIVKTVYYLWLFYVCLLFLNVLGTLAYFIGSMQNGISNKSGTTFGVSILYLVLFTPCSFVCWYRPLYKAFRSDSSFNFFVFFFIFFFQFCVCILQCLGIDGFGTCGIISGLGIISRGGGGPATVGGIMILVGLMFGLNALANIVVLIKVHRIYRSTGASFEKAQAEFAQGVMSNRHVQEGAQQAATAAARNAVQSQAGDNRY